jgi:hypothetical protein
MKHALYRMKMDGTSSMKISSDIPRFINVVNGWLYYIAENDGGSLYRMRTDGTARARVVDSPCAYVIVIGDWIYYTDGDQGNRLYRIRTNGSGKMQLTDFQTSWPVIEGDWIYLNGNPTIDGTTSYKVYKMHPDGTERTSVMNNTAIRYFEGWAYISFNGSNLKRQRLDSSSLSMIHIGRAIYMATVDDWIYFIDFDDGQHLHRARADGSEETDLNDEAVAEGISIDGWIYYIHDLVTGDLVRLRTDGSERQVLK